MSADRQTINEVVSLWHRATAAGDVDTVLSLMAEDAVFLVAGHPPIRGRNAFEQGLRGVLAGSRIESSSEVQEIEVSGDMAYCWNQLTVRVVLLADGEPTIRSGSALSIFRKEPNGSWVLVRDANLLAPAS